VSLAVGIFKKSIGSRKAAVEFFAPGIRDVLRAHKHHAMGIVEASRGGVEKIDDQ
jgi:hypothetical protein